MKIFLNIIRGIIIAYLVIFALMEVLLFTKKKIYKEVLPTVMDGRSYIVVKGDGLKPDIESGRLLIFEKTSSYNTGDYIVYQEGETYLVGKITNNELYKYEVLNNSLFSTIIKILINPITLVILLFVGTIFPELVYNK